MTAMPQGNKKATARKISETNNKVLVRTGSLGFFKKNWQTIKKFWSVHVPVRETIRIQKYEVLVFFNFIYAINSSFISAIKRIIT